MKDKQSEKSNIFCVVGENLSKSLIKFRNNFDFSHPGKAWNTLFNFFWTESFIKICLYMIYNVRPKYFAGHKNNINIFFMKILIAT